VLTKRWNAGSVEEEGIWKKSVGVHQGMFLVGLLAEECQTKVKVKTSMAQEEDVGVPQPQVEGLKEQGVRLIGLSI
jgi:hypothetical protein